MINVTKPRKVNESKILLKNSSEQKRKNKAKTKATFKPTGTSLVDILAQFNDPLAVVVAGDTGSLDLKETRSEIVEQCQITSISVCQLLSSLQSLLNNRRKSDIDSIKLQTQSCTKEELAISTMKCLSHLNRLLSNSSDSSITSFPETITLAGLSIAFLLINYFSIQHGTSNDGCPETSLLSAIELYFKFLKKSTYEITIDDLMPKGQRFPSEQNELTLCNIVNEIIDHKLTESTVSFRDVALMSGFLNCSQMVEKLLNRKDDILLLFNQKLFFYIHRFCLAKMNHEFHVYRLLNQYLKILLENLFKNRPKDEIKQYLNELFAKTLPIVDNNLESPVPGVGSLIRQTYAYLIKLAKFNSFRIEDETQPQTFLLQQFTDSLNLPYSCKAKYRKLSTLLQTLPTEEIDLKNFSVITLKKFPLPSSSLKLFEIPFCFDANFGEKLIEHISINSLASSIGDFYKSFILALVESYKNDPMKITDLWSKYWRDPIVQIFNRMASSITVVQNQLSAHIFPVTLQNIPNSIEILFLSIGNRNIYGQITVLRIFLEKCSSGTNVISSFLPPPSWIKQALVDCDDMTRAEALAILIDEKFLTKSTESRPLVCHLVLCFIQTNLNIDNATFRQRIISKLERFFGKIVNSICDRYSESDKPVSSEDLEILQFFHETFETLIISLLPGSSFQRKYTSLNILAFLIKSMETKNYGQIVRKLFKRLEGKSTLMIDSMEQYLLFALIDKDDKIRRLTNEILIQYRKSNWFQQCERQQSMVATTELSSRIFNVSIHFLQSPRHQESHIGGLLQKYLLRCNDLSKITQLSKLEDSLGESLVQHLIQTARSLFYSDKFRNNLLCYSRSDPLHGWILALNHCLTFDSFYDGLVLSSTSSENLSDVDRFLALFQQKDFRSKVFEPCVSLALDCLDYFLKLLTPKHSKPDNCFNNNYQNDINEEEDNFASPSFLEMCQSIQEIIEESKNSIPTESKEDKDVFLSNNFQLILSMCWLNLKENCFLLNTVTSLFADILCMVNDNYFGPEKSLNIKPFLLISPEQLNQIGMQIVTVMLKCRHKGVIEASGVSLTKFIRTQLRIQYYLSSIVFDSRNDRYGHAEVCRGYRTSFESFIGEIINNIIDCRRESASSSVTRRSAGLALIVQAILVGEVEAIYQDCIEPLEQNSGGVGNIYHRIISLLFSIAKSPITSITKDLAEQQVDLPQANALHVLQSIIGTSALSHLTTKTVEQLFPLCVDGFNSPEWQIRNASLQLFGSCISRMLGQKKRAKSSVSSSGETVDPNNLLEQFGCTILMEEFAARYPTLLDVIVRQFDSCILPESLNPELVPILSLLALFTPAGSGSNRCSDLPIIQSKLQPNLVRFLRNRIWKIRMLAAKSLTNLLTIEQLEKFIVDQLGEEHLLSLNYLHGLLCCAENLLELLQNSNQSNVATIKDSLFGKFKYHIQKKKCSILDKILMELFQDDKSQVFIEQCEEDDDDEDSASENIQEEINNDGNKLQSYFQCLNLKGQPNQLFLNLNSEDRLKVVQLIIEPPQLHQSLISNSIHFEILMEIRQNVTFKKSDDIRYRAALELFQILQSTILISMSPLFDDYFLLPFVEIMLVLLEDEERRIRVVAQKIVTILFRDKFQEEGEVKMNFQSQSIAIDCLFEWIIRFCQKYPEKNRSLVEFFQFRLLNSAIDRFEGYQLENLEDDLILFEKEEKNVFAEPFLLATKIGHCLQRLTSTISIPIYSSEQQSATEKYLCSKLNRLLQKFQDTVIETSEKDIKFDQLLCLSIWKLPKYIASLTSVYFGMKNLKSDSKESAKFNSFLMQLEHKFPFLNSLRARMSCPGVELIEMSV